MYINQHQLQEAFVNHLVQICKCPEHYARTISEAFPNTFACPFLEEDWIGDCKIGSDDYVRYSAYTTLERIGFPGVPNFFFYIYYKKADVTDRTVGAYAAADKLYQCTELDKEDFPQLKYEKKKKLILHNFK